MSYSILIKFVQLSLMLVLAGCSTIHTENQPSHIRKSEAGYIQVNQGKLFYQKFGSGKPIVILHGGPGMLDQNYLLPQMLELAKDHEVIFYDQRGSGKSLETKIDKKYINTDSFVDDLEKLRKTLGLKEFTLIGQSWGGFLAMNYTIKYPKCVSNLILLSTAAPDYKGQQAFIAEFTKRTEPIKNEIKALFSYDDFKELTAEEIYKIYKTLFSVYFYDRDNLEGLSLTMDPLSAQSGFKVMEEMSKTSWMRPHINLFPALKSLKIKTLIIHGNQDICPIQSAKEIKDAIPNSKLVCLDQCGHFPYIEKQKETFFAIREFLKQ